MFADLNKFRCSRNGLMQVDACVFSTPDGKPIYTVAAQAQHMFDNAVLFTGYRIICGAPLSEANFSLDSLWLGLSFEGESFAPRIPIVQVRHM